MDLVPAKPLKKSVTLAAIKAAPALKDVALLKQSRLSVMPLTAEEYAVILKLSA